jgi:hypothetical protein
MHQFWRHSRPVVQHHLLSGGVFRDADTDRNFDRIANLHVDSDGDRNKQCHADNYVNCHVDCDRYQHHHADGDRNLDRLSDGDTYNDGDSYTDWDCYAALRARLRLPDYQSRGHARFR